MKFYSARECTSYLKVEDVGLKDGREISLARAPDLTAVLVHYAGLYNSIDNKPSTPFIFQKVICIDHKMGK